MNRKTGKTQANSDAKPAKRPAAKAKTRRGADAPTYMESGGAFCPTAAPTAAKVFASAPNAEGNCSLNLD